MNKEEKETSDNSLIQRSMLLGGTQSPTDVNFQRFQPLPSIKDAALKTQRQHGSETGFASMPPVQYNIRNSSSIESMPSVQYNIKNSSPKLSEKTPNQFGDKFTNGKHSLNMQYKWLQTANEVANQEFTPNFMDHTRSKANLKKYPYGTEIKNDLKKTEKPSFLVRNSKCVRQLPPLESKHNLTSRPACPSPVSPPTTPTSAMNDFFN